MITEVLRMAACVVMLLNVGVGVFVAVVQKKFSWSSWFIAGMLLYVLLKL